MKHRLAPTPSHTLPFEQETEACPIPPVLSSRMPVLFCFSERDKARFWPEEEDSFAQLIEEGGFLQTPPLDAACWRELLLEIRPAAIVGAWSLPAIPDDLLESVPEFRYLCYFSGQVRGKISRRFLEGGGLVTNWGHLASATVAECALALVLACLRRITHYAIKMHIEKTWSALETAAPQSFRGRRVGIHGLGAVARELIPLLRPFNNHIESYSEGAPEGLFSANGVRRAKSLEELFSRNEIVIEAEAINSYSYHSVTKAILLSLPPGGVFVNVGRGEVLAPGAIEALARRSDVALGLDVYDQEPLPGSSPLRGLPHVTLLPHTAGPTLDQYPAIRNRCLGFLDQFLCGAPLGEAITLEMFDRMT